MGGSLNRRQVVTGAAALGLSAAVVPAIGRSGVAAQSASPVPGGTLKVGLQADPTALDPQQQSLTALWHVVEHIYDTLIEVDASLAPQPALAASWELSADGLTYTFKLQPNVQFHDGSMLKASDVVFSYSRQLDAKTASPTVSSLMGIEGAKEFNAGTAETVTGLKALDDATVEITLVSPDASFITVLSDTSQSIFSQAFAEANDMTQTAMGTGPFKFVEYIPNTSVKLEKFADHWRTGLPYVDAIEMLVAPEDTARTTSLIQGTTNFIEYAPLRDVDTLQQNADLVLTGNTNTNIRFVTFNMDKEPFNNLKVRQAIAMAVDRTPMIDAAIFGHGTPVSTIFPPDYWAALVVDIPPADIEGAKALLAEAGYPDGFKTSITSWSQYSFLSNAAVVLQEQLKQIGIDAELNLVENATMVEKVHIPASKDYEIGVTGTSAYVDPAPLILSYFGTGESSNASGYSNPQVDEWIAQAAVESDQETRATLYQQIQQQLLDDLPWINLFVANQYEAMKANVKGFTHIPTGTNYKLREVWIEE